MNLHHYTTIETLALILHYRKIRFNKLTNVDDIEESELYGQINLAPYLYVSCWTTSSEENIPLWTMYTQNMCGVRISFDGKPFNYRKITNSPENIIPVKGAKDSPLTLEQIFNKDYLVDFGCLFEDKFGGHVTYTDEIENIYKDAVTLDPKGKFFDIVSPNMIALHKRKVWAFQEEYRFNLLAYPCPEGGYNVDNLKSIHLFSRNAFLNKIVPPIDYIDVDICPEKIKNMVVTLGPLTTAADEMIVTSLLEKYAPEAKVRHSNLRGRIREK